MGKRVGLALLAALMATGAWSAEPAPGLVQDYEARLEEIAREIRDLRREVEILVNEVVAGESTQIYVFLEGPAPAFRDVGAALAIDGRPVLSRPLTQAEIDVLNRGLPLELFSGRMSAGQHQVSLAPLGAKTPDTVTLDAKKGGSASVVGRPGASGLEWRIE